MYIIVLYQDGVCIRAYIVYYRINITYYIHVVSFFNIYINEMKIEHPVNLVLIKRQFTDNVFTINKM